MFFTQGLGPNFRKGGKLLNERPAFAQLLAGACRDFLAGMFNSAESYF